MGGLMWKYILDGVTHYRRINLVVLTAVAISTAVIAGSLIVGDSVRFSLRRMTEQRLGGITDVLSGPRFIRQQLADDLSADVTGGTVCSPAILLTAAVEATVEGPVEDAGGETTIRRAGSVTILATDESGWSLLDHGQALLPSDRQIVLGYRTALELQAGVGDEVSVWIELPTSIPRDSLLGERDDVNVELVLTVSAVLDEQDGASRFDLNPGQQLPYNAFVPLTTLQERLGVEERAVSKRNPNAQPARINSLLTGRPFDKANVRQRASDSSFGAAAEFADAVGTAQVQTDALLRRMNMEDVELRIRDVAEHGYLSVESDRMILEDGVVRAVTAAAGELGLKSAGTLVYLINELSAADRK
ncbi:MAG: hypothetical protein KDA89_17715, partial [Planctomycetaceae bacterium]|nr:hypothetical protein [Planctomycetaceae bacterium]